jgi:redox-sensitive bicupin YhaK (pirin superfamily)
MPSGYTTLLFVLEGEILLASGEKIETAELAVLSQEEEAFSLTAIANSKILVLGGEPIHEPVVGNGPFVMNSQNEIEQAWLDFKTGKMRLD